MRLLPGEGLTRAMAPNCWLLVILGEAFTRGRVIVTVDEVLTRGP